jgi:hypothetical protein
LNGLPAGNWTLNPGGIAGTGASYTVTNLAPATYSWSVTNAAGCTSALSTPPVTIVPYTTNTPGYCAASSNSSSMLWISKVSLGTSNSSLAANYSDFTGKTFNLIAGNNVTLFVWSSTSSPSQIPVYYRAWIDYNNNNSFNDAGEEIMPTKLYNNGVYSSGFSLPNTAANTRMRVAVSYGGPATSGGAIPQSCGTFPHGEVEDYTVNIALPAIHAVPTGLGSDCIFSTSAKIDWNAVSDVTSHTTYDVQYRTGSGAWTIVNTGSSMNSLKLNNLTANTTYEVQVRANNLAGSSAWSASAPLFTTDVAYCSAQGTDASSLYIKGVAINGSTNLGNVVGSGYVASCSNITLTSGTTALMVLNPGHTPSNAASIGVNWKVWIDYNRDGIFTDQGELVTIIGGYNSNSYNAVSTTLMVKANIQGSYRMRIAMAYNGAGQTAVSCGTFAQGQVVDCNATILALKDAPVVNDAEKAAAITNSLALYPNPASTVVNFNIDLQGQTLQAVRVIDIFGKVISEQLANQVVNNQVQLGDNIAAGFYELQLQTKEGTVATKTFIVTP